MMRGMLFVKSHCCITGSNEAKMSGLNGSRNRGPFIGADVVQSRLELGYLACIECNSQIANVRPKL